MQLNPASWRIPAVVHANFLTSKAFKKAIVAVASNFRGDMRRKIRRSITDKLDIGGMAKRLCIKGYQPTVGHWRRFALLQSYMQDWDKLPVKSGKSRRTPYWTFIDSKLDKLQEKCAKSNDKDTQKAIKEMLKAVVVQDQKKYKGPASGATKLPSKVHMPGWQKDHAKAVQEMSGYAVDASPEDDVEDDEDDGDDDASTSGASNNREHEGGGENIDTPAVTGNNNSTEQLHDMPDEPAGRILVPATQEAGGSSSPAGEVGGWSNSATVGALGSTSGQAEQSGWNGGSLADRRPRSSHTAPSPLTRPHQPPASSSRHR
ncbi:hypothetical protein FS749_013826 [Ceratobasidium sp. UAMH 11750]|nr:hypothetical protein FS749_013826 [Ceratobasidium sp. UAMH 11750]